MAEFGDVVAEGVTASRGDCVIEGVISAWGDRIGDGVALGASVDAFGGGVVVGAIVAWGDSVLNWGDCVAVTVATAAWVDYVAVTATAWGDCTEVVLRGGTTWVVGTGGSKLEDLNCMLWLLQHGMEFSNLWFVLCVVTVFVLLSSLFDKIEYLIVCETAVLSTLLFKLFIKHYYFRCCY